MFAVVDQDIATSAGVEVLHVFLGDYIDRGAYSRETVDLLIDRSKRFPSVFLKGNHEQMLLEVVADPRKLQSWLKYGGMQTLLSYGMEPSQFINNAGLDVDGLVRLIPPSHRSFFSQLQPKYSIGDFLFVHAGIDPAVPLNEQNEGDFLWIREKFLRSNRIFERYVVHGHTPVTAPDFRENRANIDTGAYATKNLTVLMIQGRTMLAF